MKAKNSRQHIIELDGVTYRYSGDRLEQIADMNDVQGDKWLISDLQMSVARTMTIEAPVKYAEVMVRKRLQESGEFDEPISVVTHWKQKKDKNTTDIFFTAVPTRIFHRYFEQIEEHEDNILLFPLFSVLHGVVKRMRHPKPVAVIFLHSRFADLVIGTRKRIYYANRSMAFDTSEEQICGICDMVRKDIAAAEVENKIQVDRILFLNWIDGAPKPEWPCDTGRELLYLEEEEIFFDGQKQPVSFLKALRMQSAFWSLSSPLEKLSYCSQRCLPYLNILFLLGALLCVGGYCWCDREANLLKRQFATMQGQMAALQHKVPVREVSYKETLSFVRELAHYRKAPAYKSVINDISEALPESIFVEVLKVDYTGDEVKIEIFGKAKAPFDDAYRGYQRFINVLTQRGYQVAESKFDTKIRQSEFLARFTKRI